MRFACDRCKTRYSIADERVRGKILKIRCKTCANVITVKEGMEVPAELADPSPAPSGRDWPGNGAAERGERASRSTTMAPQSTVGAGGAAPLTPAPKPAPAPALGAAFASAMAAPPAPPQLEDEWYVSRDGDQQGPFSLHNAQAWVSQQPYEAELYCWCEGFDDWLPVDRIAHFRGLRARPLPAAAPPSSPAAAPSPARPISGPLPALNRSPTRPNPTVPAGAAAAGMSAAPAPAAEEQPQFAATMAALAGEPAATPAPGRGAASWPTAATTATGGAPPMPGMPSSAPQGSGNGRSAFDAGDLGSQGFSTDAGPSGRRAVGSSSPIPIGASTATAASPSAASSSSLPAAGDDEMEFGEVSRVVRIADIGKTVRPQARAVSTPGVRRTGAHEVLPPELSAGLPGFRPPPASPRPGSIPPASGLLPALGAPEARAEVPLVIPAAQRRNHALLLGLVAAGLVGVAVGAMVLLQSDDGPTDSGMLSLGGGNVSDMTIRPDDPRRSGGGPGSAATVDEPAGSAAKPAGSGGTAPIRRPGGGAIATNPGGATPQPGGPTPGGKIEVTPTQAALTPLSGTDVEEMSQRNSTGLQRCYEQALKKDIGIEVKSLKVTISINAAGAVTDVAMSNSDSQTLVQCMTLRIRGWRFRPNTKGLDAKFTVAFGRT